MASNTTTINDPTRSSSQSPIPARPNPARSIKGEHDDTSIRDELNALKDQMAELAANKGSAVIDKGADALKAVQQTTSDVAHQLGETASNAASAVSDQAKTFANELERMGRNNPLGVIAGALLVGVVIGLMGRRS